MSHLQDVQVSNISLIRGIAFSGGAGVKLTMNTQSNSLSMITATSLMFECNCVMENAQYRSTFDIAINSGYSQLSNSRTLIQLNSNHFNSNMGMMSLGIFFNTLLTANIVYNSLVEIVDCTFMDVSILFMLNQIMQLSLLNYFINLVQPSQMFG